LQIYGNLRLVGWLAIGQLASLLTCNYAEEQIAVEIEVVIVVEFFCLFTGWLPAIMKLR